MSLVLARREGRVESRRCARSDGTTAHRGAVLMIAEIRSPAAWATLGEVEQGFQILSADKLPTALSRLHRDKAAVSNSARHEYRRLASFHPTDQFVSSRVRGTSRASAPRRASLQTVAADKNVLYDVPVSNNGARCRLIIYWKQLEDEFAITNPTEVGGLKSEEYLAMNPQGKMPLLMTADGLALPESEVISQWICDEYSEVGPELKPEDPETRAICALATRIHDVYIVPIQGCMYRGPMDVKTRADQLAEVAKQLDVIEGAMSLRDGPSEREGAVNRRRCAVPDVRVHRVHPPKHFGWKDVFVGRPRTAEWWEAMRLDTCGARVYGEIRGGLESWESNGGGKLWASQTRSRTRRSSGRISLCH